MKLSNTLVAALLLSVVAMSGLIAYQLFGQSKVLGESIMDNSGQTQKQQMTLGEGRQLVEQGVTKETQAGICADLNRMTKQYCGQVVVIPSAYPTTQEISIVPTKILPIPTIACKTGLNSYSVGIACKKPGNTFVSAKYACYDGFSGVVKSPNGECASSTQLQMLAMNACVGHSNCVSVSTRPPVKR